MTFHTPLRYPGGKRRLAPFVMGLMESNGLRDVAYVEPYAGGASLALALLFEEYAAEIHINDLSRLVYAFWHSVLYDTDALCDRIEAVSVTMEEWQKQRGVYDQRDKAELADLGFAALFLNRTNRSGIISGGVIGGKQQTGKWLIDARFSKSELVNRIRRIGRYRNRIHLHHQEGLTLVTDVVPTIANAFVFCDPPYIDKGTLLYLNTYGVEDHNRLAAAVANLHCPWIASYDYGGAMRCGLFPGHARLEFKLSYSAQARYGGSEAVFLSKDLKIPSAWANATPVQMSRRGSRYPLFGTLECMADQPSQPVMDEGPEASERFHRAMKAVLAAPKEAAPNPFKKPGSKSPGTDS